MELLLALYLYFVLAISYFAYKADKINKGFKPDAADGDNDGWVQDGTRWQRKVR
jgi:hypothetical protein